MIELWSKLSFPSPRSVNTWPQTPKSKSSTPPNGTTRDPKWLTSLTKQRKCLTRWSGKRS